MNRSTIETVDDKKQRLSLLFSSPIINGKKVEISYQKAFKMVFERVSQMLGENTDENTTFEPLKKPVDKEKSRAFGHASSCLAHLCSTARTIFMEDLG